MSKVLLLGKNGMLGQAIEEAFANPSQSPTPSDSPFVRGRTIRNGRSTISPPNEGGEKGEVVAFDRSDLDITNKRAVFAKIEQLKPAIVINAIGYTNVDGAETEKETAFAVNAEAVGNIAEICARINAALFHFSTDYIFDGTQSQGYREDEVEHIGPVNVYGKSKLEGERIIREKFSIFNFQFSKESQFQISKYFIIRTSWLYGTGGKNFVDTLLTRAQGGQTEFKVVNDQYGKPTYAKDLAQQVVWMVERKDALKQGIYHCTNEVASCGAASGISWYEFACEIFKQAHQLGIIKTQPAVTPCTTAEFPRPAIRPQYSSLTNTKLPPLPEWREALRTHIKTYCSLTIGML